MSCFWAFSFPLHADVKGIEGDCKGVALSASAGNDNDVILYHLGPTTLPSTSSAHCEARTCHPSSWFAAEIKPLRSAPDLNGPGEGKLVRLTWP